MDAPDDYLQMDSVLIFCCPASANGQHTSFSGTLRTGITTVYISSGAVLRCVWQTPLCNLYREVYNETKAEGFLSVFAVVLLAEGVDRNFDTYTLMAVQRRSSSSRRTWIEIPGSALGVGLELVVLLAEDVDRNC